MKCLQSSYIHSSYIVEPLKQIIIPCWSKIKSIQQNLITYVQAYTCANVTHNQLFLCVNSKHWCSTERVLLHTNTQNYCVLDNFGYNVYLCLSNHYRFYVIRFYNLIHSSYIMHKSYNNLAITWSWVIESLRKLFWYSLLHNRHLLSNHTEF